MLARNLSDRKRLKKYLDKVDKDENGFIYVEKSLVEIISQN